MDETVNIELIQISLDRVNGSDFEKFFQAFYPTIGGEEFVPCGGEGDGGADAFQGNRLFQGKTTGIYYQASIQEDYRAKIRYTVKRLFDFGRKPTSLIYFTSRTVKNIDIEETNLTNELSVIIKIRDSKYIAAHINDSTGTRAAFRSFLSPCLNFLKTIGNSQIISPSEHVSSPAIYVFLRQELDRSQGKENLINSLADGLILWALEGTDPEKNNFLNIEEITNKIERTIPSTSKILHGVIPKRLQELSKIPKGSSRPIRRYHKEEKYCLSHEIREQVEQDNANDVALRLATLDAFENRLAEKFRDKLDPTQRHITAEISLAVIQKTFENEGIEFAAFLEGKHIEPSFETLADHVDTCLLKNKKIRPNEFELLKEAVLTNLRGAFYESTLEERLLFSKLSATYTLLFCLKTEPRIVQYFQNMASDFYLYVGSDILVRALSERYLRPEDQMTRNTLKLINEAGGKLILSEPVLEEVYSHISVTDYEFRDSYQQIEPSVNKIIARNADRILIRAYFYAKLMPPIGIKKPKNWPFFINQFCDYNCLHKDTGREQLKRYLLSQYNMEFESESDILTLVDASELDELSKRILIEKSDPRLARNDALMVLAVYGRRHQMREHSKISEFGYRTWWLTDEIKIFKHTKDIVDKNGSCYMMRPEFVLNFLTLSPSAIDVRRSYREIFPSLLGIRLARRVKTEELKNVLKKLQETQDIEPGRMAALISELSDKLKGDFKKQYEHTLDKESTDQYGPFS